MKLSNLTELQDYGEEKKDTTQQQSSVKPVSIIPQAKSLASPVNYKPSKTGRSYNPTAIKEHLLSKGLSEHAVKGILGNIQRESNFNSKAVGDGNTSIGLFQHHADRAKKLGNYLKLRGKDLDDGLGQVDYAYEELKSMPKVMKMLNSAKSPAQAADIWVRHFERPANVNNESRIRQQYAMKYKFGGIPKYKLGYADFSSLGSSLGQVVDNTQNEENPSNLGGFASGALKWGSAGLSTGNPIIAGAAGLVGGIAGVIQAKKKKKDFQEKQLQKLGMFKNQMMDDSNMRYQQFNQQSINSLKTYAKGGSTQPLYEAEDKEVIVGQDVQGNVNQIASNVHEVQGKTHDEYNPNSINGTGEDIQGGDFVFSDSLTPNGKQSFAELAFKIGKQKGKNEIKLSKMKGTDYIFKNTYQANIQKADNDIQQLAQIQESMKENTNVSQMRFGGIVKFVDRGLIPKPKVIPSNLQGLKALEYVKNKLPNIGAEQLKKLIGQNGITKEHVVDFFKTRSTGSSNLPATIGKAGEYLGKKIFEGVGGNYNNKIYAGLSKVVPQVTKFAGRAIPAVSTAYTVGKWVKEGLEDANKRSGTLINTGYGATQQSMDFNKKIGKEILNNRSKQPITNNKRPIDLNEFLIDTEIPLGDRRNINIDNTRPQSNTSDIRPDIHEEKIKNPIVKNLKKGIVKQIQTATTPSTTISKPTVKFNDEAIKADIQFNRDALGLKSKFATLGTDRPKTMSLDDGIKNGSIGGKKFDFGKVKLGQASIFANYIANRTGINKMKTDVPVQLQENPDYMYRDSTGLQRQNVKSVFNSIVNSPYTTQGSKQESYGRTLDALNQVQDQENNRFFSYNQAYNQNRYGVRQQNNQMINNARIQEIQNQNQQKALQLENNNNLSGNLNTYQREQNDLMYKQHAMNNFTKIFADKSGMSLDETKKALGYKFGGFLNKKKKC